MNEWMIKSKIPEWLYEERAKRRKKKVVLNVDNGENEKWFRI